MVNKNATEEMAPSTADQEETVETTAAPAQASVPGEETPDVAPAQSRADTESLQTLLEDARSRADENWNELLRARAELDNLRKRHEREMDGARKYAIERFVSELLPVRDSMELGLGATEDASVDLEKLREGHELTLKLLDAAMNKFKIQPVNPEGEPFNPEHHQAMSTQERADVPPNTVVTVVQKGYLLNDRVVRPAMVIVSRAPSSASPEETHEQA